MKQGTDRFTAYLKGKQYSLKIRPQFLVTKGKEGTMAAIAKSKTPVSKVMDELNKTVQIRQSEISSASLLHPKGSMGGIGQREREMINFRLQSTQFNN